MTLVVQTTQVAAEALAAVCDQALDFPKASIRTGGGNASPTPSTWNNWGAPPHAWTKTLCPLWFSTVADVWYELTDTTATAVANSSSLTAGQKALVAGVLAGRVNVADPSQGHARTARFKNRLAMRVCCDGDSWTTGSTAGFHSWRTRVQTLALADSACPAFEFVGPVVSGDSVSPASNQHNGLNGTGIASHNGAAQTTLLDTYWPDILIRFLGTNDAASGPVDVAAYKSAFVAAHTSRPAMKLFWTTQPDLFSDANLAAFNAAIPTAASELTTADPTMKLATLSLTGVITAGDTSAQHPTAAGYDKLADAIFPALKAFALAA